MRSEGAHHGTNQPNPLAYLRTHGRAHDGAVHRARVAHLETRGVQRGLGPTDGRARGELHAALVCGFHEVAQRSRRQDPDQRPLDRCWVRDAAAVHRSDGSHGKCRRATGGHC